MENLIKASTILYDKQICDTMNKLNLKEKIIQENEYKEIIFQNYEEYENKIQHSLKMLETGIKNNIHKFKKSFSNDDNPWNNFINRIEINMGTCFYNTLYDSLFYIFNDELYCKYQTQKILFEIDRTLDVLYDHDSLNIFKKSKENFTKIIYNLIKSYLIHQDYDDMGIFDCENICYFICNICNKKTNYERMNLDHLMLKTGIFCVLCKPDKL